MDDRVPARIVICVPALAPTFFADEVEGTCALCSQAVRVRANAPARRVLVCLKCFLVHAEPGTTCEVLGEAVSELESRGYDFDLHAETG